MRIHLEFATSKKHFQKNYLRVDLWSALFFYKFLPEQNAGFVIFLAILAIIGIIDYRMFVL